MPATPKPESRHHDAPGPSDENYSSDEGFPLYKDHVYEIEALYNNTTDHDVDAMAMMVLYYYPKGDVSVTYTGR